MDLSLEQISQAKPTRSSGGKVAARKRSGSQNRTNPYGNDTNQEFGLYVGNLPWSCAWQNLKDMFKPFGNVIYADVATEGGRKGARSKGWGRVKYATQAECNRAIQAMNGTQQDGRQMEVRLDRQDGGTLFSIPSLPRFVCFWSCLNHILTCFFFLSFSMSMFFF
jgi:RNA recognition motif-containing protein